MIPNKLKPGDEIRVIAPSRSLSIISKNHVEIAQKRFEEMGFAVSFGNHVEECDEHFKSSSIESRIEDLHDAFVDGNVKGILTVIGGFNSNQLLKYLDYDLISSNPKVLCGYSDITALQNAIFAKTGLVTYSGPHFSTFGMLQGIEYTAQQFRNCLMNNDPFEVKASETWSDDEWYLDQNKREFIKNEGIKILNHGTAEGTVVGGNLGTFNLLQGTEFMPDLKDCILFLEDDNFARDSTPVEVDRNLQSIIHLPEFKSVRAIAFGRFQKLSAMSGSVLSKIISSKKELSSIPPLSGKMPLRKSENYSYVGAGQEIRNASLFQ